MAEVAKMIPVGDFYLEALYEAGQDARVAILCHPHPLYGGDMENAVVVALRDVMRGWGWGTLRFNFRGVGGSGGEYGEGDGETEDVLAVASHLRDQGSTVACLAGYSFGAWVALKGVRRGLDADSLILVSPPVDVLRFDDLTLPSVPCLITLGDEDGFCRVASLREWISAQAAVGAGLAVEVLAGCDHFYWRHQAKLADRVADFLQARFSRGVS